MRQPWRHGALGSIVVGLFVWQAACTKLDDLNSPSCTYTLTPATAQFDNRGGEGTLTIQTANVCAWTVANSDPWLAFSGERSGSGNGVVAYAVAANPESAGRTATLTVGEQAATVNQAGDAGPNCTFVVEPTSGAFGPAGGSGAVGVTAAADCRWTSTSQAAWIGISSGGSGSGSGPVEYVVAANTSFNSRTGTLTVAGQVVTVSQVGVGSTCSYAVSPTSASFSAGGGTGTVTVAAQPGCGWGAASGASWITITAGSPGSGNGAVQYAIAANAATASRTGSLTVAGQVVTITQAGTGTACSYTAAPGSASYTGAGGTGTIAITTQAGCPWSATSQAPWITVTGGASGTGTGTIQYSVAANTASAGRTSSIIAGGQTITITQNGTGPTCMYGISPNSASYPAAASSGSVTVTTQDGCAWAASSQATWIAVTAGASGTGSGTVQYTVAANPDPDGRTATLSVATQTVTISQAGTSPSCTYNAAPETAFYPAVGGSGAITVTTQPGCVWAAASQVTWVTITQGSSGSGNGAVQYSVAANIGANAREGTLTVGGRTVTITQDGIVSEAMRSVPAPVVTRPGAIEPPAVRIRGSD
jgi:hypothetical protein